MAIKRQTLLIIPLLSNTEVNVYRLLPKKRTCGHIFSLRLHNRDVACDTTKKLNTPSNIALSRENIKCSATSTKNPKMRPEPISPEKREKVIVHMVAAGVRKPPSRILYPRHPADDEDFHDVLHLALAG
jgi:hypothetical protein